MERFVRWSRGVTSTKVDIARARPPERRPQSFRFGSPPGGTFSSDFPAEHGSHLDNPCRQLAATAQAAGYDEDQLAGNGYDRDAFEACVRDEVAECVRRQAET